MEVNKNISIYYENIRLKNEEELENRKKEIYRKIPQIKKIDDYIKDLAIKSCKNLYKNPSSNLVMDVTREIMDLKKEKERILISCGFDKDYMSIKYNCLYCKDTGFLEDGSKCSCLKKLVIDNLYKTSNLNHTLKKENFIHFDENIFSDKVYEKEGMSPRENIKKIKEISKKFIDSFKEDNDFNLLFYGPTGQGKTFMINCIAKELLDRNFSVIYLTAYEIVELLENKRFKKVDDKKYDLLFESNLLIVDDLGIELVSSFTNSEIFNIINTRLIRGKKTVISTNLSPKELSEIYTDRVFSRVFQKFMPLKFFGEDLRWQ